MYKPRQAIDFSGKLEISGLKTVKSINNFCTMVHQRYVDRFGDPGLAGQYVTIIPGTRDKFRFSQA